MESVLPLTKFYDEQPYLVENLCPIHPCRRMDVLNYFRNMAHGELSIASLIKFEQVTLITMNAHQADMPSPCLRKSAFNDSYETSTPLICRCTRGEQQMPYNLMPEMQALNREKKLEGNILGALARLVQVSI